MYPDIRTMKHLLLSLSLSLCVLLLAQNLQAQTLTFTLGTPTGAPGDTVVVPVSVDNFNTIHGYQGTFSWDSAALDFIDMSSPTAGISNIYGNPGQGLIPLDRATFTWVNFSGTGTTLTNGTAVMEIRFEIKSSTAPGVYPVEMDSSVTNVAYSNGISLFAPAINQGSVTVSGFTGLTFTMATDTAEQGDTVILPITVENFTTISGYQGTITWDSAALDFLDLQSPATGINNFTGLPGQGLIPLDAATFSWIDFSGGNVTLQDSTAVLEIHFVVKSSALQGVYPVEINGSVTQFLYTQGAGVIVPAANQGSVTILNDPMPVAVCQDLTVYLDSMGMAVIQPEDLDGGSSGGGGAPQLSVSQESFACGDLGLQPVMLIVSDGSGNADTCMANVTVEDTIAPTAMLQDITMYLDSSGMESISITDLDTGSFDACGIASMTFIYSLTALSTDCFEVGGPYPVEVFLTDASGNETIETVQVSVADTIAPSVLCRNLTVMLDSSGMAVITPEMLDSTSSDNCGIMDMTLSQDTFRLADIGTNSVVLTVTDQHGNSSFCEAMVIVEGSTSSEDLFQQGFAIRLFPNPADDQVQIGWESPMQGPVSITVLNQLGQTVIAENRMKQAEVLELGLNIDRLPAGMYFMQVEQEGRMLMERLIVK